MALCTRPRRKAATGPARPEPVFVVAADQLPDALQTPEVGELPVAGVFQHGEEEDLAEFVPAGDNRVGCKK